ncbi:MAG: 30S ribosomal protein S4e [Candidatus Diapherotrites archaeon]
MAKKGEGKSQKRLSAQKAMFLPRKGKVWAIKGRPGPHSSQASVPLGFVLRDLLGIAKTLKEAKKILLSGAVHVNGVVRTEYRLPVGIFDLIELPGVKKVYRAVIDSKQRIAVRVLDAKAEKARICKVTGKKTAKKGMVQLTFNDGTVLLEKKTKLKCMDSAKLSVPEKKILAELALSEGSLAYLLTGKSAGAVARIKKIFEATMRKPRVVELEQGKNVFQTNAENVLVVGEKKLEIDLGIEEEKNKRE